VSASSILVVVVEFDIRRLFVCCFNVVPQCGPFPRQADFLVRLRILESLGESRQVICSLYGETAKQDGTIYHVSLEASRGEVLYWTVLIARTSSQKRVNCTPTGQQFDVVNCGLQIIELGARLCAEPQRKCVPMDTTAAGNIKDLQGSAILHGTLGRHSSRLDGNAYRSCSRHSPVDASYDR
jgi:hypothetical protein